MKDKDQNEKVSIERRTNHARKRKEKNETLIIVISIFREVRKKIASLMKD